MVYVLGFSGFVDYYSHGVKSKIIDIASKPNISSLAKPSSVLYHIIVYYLLHTLWRCLSQGKLF